MFKLIRTCEGYYLTTLDYHNSSGFFYELPNNMGIVEVTCYEIEKLKQDCWYVYDYLEAIKKAFGDRIPYEHKKYCFVVYDKDNSSFCLLGDSIDDINYNLQFFNCVHDLYSSYPFAFLYS